MKTARRARRVRCESCLAVIESRHSWDSVGCDCGALSVSGRPWRPRILWLGSAGGGWSEVDPGGGTSSEEAAPPPPRRLERIGYR